MLPNFLLTDKIVEDVLKKTDKTSQKNMWLL